MKTNEYGLPLVGEIKHLNFDPRANGKKGHLAVCHAVQGYGANGWQDNDLIRKAKDSNGALQEIIKSLDGVVEESVIKALSFSNKQKALQESVEEKLRQDMSANGEYVWAYIQDFNDDMVVFSYQEKLYAVSYTITEEGVVTLGEEPKQTKRRDLYVDSDTGEELIKASQWLKKEIPDIKEEKPSKIDGEANGETPQTTPVVKEEESMSDNINLDELVKSADFQEIIKAQAAELAKQQFDELVKAQEKKALEDSTTELLKSMSFIEEGQVETLVKALLVNEEPAEIVKALSAADEVIKSHEAKIKELEDEVVKTKEEFGSKKSIDATIEMKEVQKSADSSEQRTRDLDAIVKAQLAAKNK